MGSPRTMEDGTLQCRLCRRWYPPTDYIVCRSNKFGRGYVCRSCRGLKYKYEEVRLNFKLVHQSSVPLSRPKVRVARGQFDALLNAVLSAPETGWIVVQCPENYNSRRSFEMTLKTSASRRGISLQVVHGNVGIFVRRAAKASGAK